MGQRFNFNPSASVAETPPPKNAPAKVTEHLEKLEILETKEKEAFEIRFVQRDRIRDNKKNKYPAENIERMADSILLFGLQQNLTAAYLTDEDMYVLEAGHTRARALDYLIDEFESFPEDSTDERYLLYKQNVMRYKVKGYPCLVTATIADNVLYDYDETTDLANVPDEVIDSEIRLIITNEVNRNRTPSVMAENIRRLDMLYKRRNIGLSKDEKVNVNKTIAKELRMTKTQVINYKAIGKLIPELQEAFDNNHITLKEGSNYARLSEEEQKEILSMLRAGFKVSADEVQVLLREKAALAQKLMDKESSLNEKEEEIAELKENLRQAMDPATKEESKEQAPAPADDKELKKKQKEIEKLRKEITDLKQNIPEKTAAFSSDQALAAKTELSVKSSFESCKREIRNFLSQAKVLNELMLKHQSDPDIASMGILSSSDIDSLIAKLKELLTLQEPNLTEM